MHCLKYPSEQLPGIFRIFSFLVAIAFPIFCGCKDEPQPVLPDLKKGLIAYWSFDNDEADIIIDESGNQLNGKGYSVSHETGKSGLALNFDNPEDKVVFPSLNSEAPVLVSELQEGSISVWFRFQSLGARILPIFYFGESQTGTAHNSLIIEIGHGGGANPANKRLYFTIVNQSFCYDSGFNLQENTWYHFVAVVSSTGNTGYINGVEMTTRNYNLGSNNNYSFFFNDVPVRKMLSIGYGRYGQEDPFFSFNGNIDEVRIYDRPLTEAEVMELFISAN